MEDQSFLDKKYFIDETVYNCPFCNRRNVSFKIEDTFQFNWNKENTCFGYLVKCSSCNNVSMHLSFEDISEYLQYPGINVFKKNIDIDSKIFYSVPTSFFVIDNRIHRILRELIAEAEGCLKMNYLTGSSACTRKAIYELLVLEKATGEDYESRIKSLKKKYPGSDPMYFDTLSQIQQVTSDKIHEQSWDKWDSQKLKFIIETLKAVLYEIYVLPKIKEERATEIKKLQEKVKIDGGKPQVGKD
ncbi:MAG: hypothetical protein Q8P44_09130 [Dehalococcoidia bacterium]|nr:hypothetical protein [Dehalococcoidia bacterium]